MYVQYCTYIELFISIHHHNCNSILARGQSFLSDRHVYGLSMYLLHMCVAWNVLDYSFVKHIDFHNNMNTALPCYSNNTHIIPVLLARSRVVILIRQYRFIILYIGNHSVDNYFVRHL